MTRFLMKIALLATVFVLGGPRNAPAEDFRVENRVFIEGAKESGRSLTLFHEGMVYDFLAEPAETTLFDKATGRFIFLNMAKREQAELLAADVNAFAEKLKLAASKQKDPLSRFFADPQFTETLDLDRGQLTMQSPLVSYQIVFETPKSPAIADQYREFSDNYARLNVLLNPGSRPPSARLMVNESLARHQKIAKEVTLTINSGGQNSDERPTVVRSRHDFSDTLTAADLEQIEKSRAARGSFPVVSFDKYRKTINSRK